MMDITPIWIDGYYDSHAEAAEAMQTMWQGIALEPVPTPALTLDQIEEWLRQHFIAEPVSVLHCLNELEKERNRTINDLLAQVQAMKEGTCQK